jgi:hypothetical protein
MYQVSNYLVIAGRELDLLRALGSLAVGVAILGTCQLHPALLYRGCQMNGMTHNREDLLFLHDILCY